MSRIKFIFLSRKCASLLAYSYFLEYSYLSDCLFPVLHISFRQHLSHSGLRAMQTALPCKTKRWQRSFPSSGGMIFQSSFSTLPGSLMSSTRPIRLESLMQCVSVTIAGSPKTSPIIRFALFLPTPGSASSSFIACSRICLHIFHIREI